MKRMLCLLAVFCLLVTMVPVRAWADTPQPRKVGKGSIAPQVNPLYADVLEAPERNPAPDTIRPQTELDERYGDEQQLVLDIRENLKQRNEEFSVYFKTSSANLKALITEAYNAAFDHTGVPTEGDYLTWQYGWWGADFYYWYESGYYYVEVPFYLMYYTNAQQEAELDQAVEDLLDVLDLEGKTDYEKLCGVYDYITRNIRYDYVHLEDPDYYLMYSAYAALVDETAVCQGYANLLYRLLLELGVDNRIVVGDAGGPHAWNIVKMGGWYYYADSTWDASYVQAGLPYQYFLLGSENFTWDHIPDPEESPCVLTYPINTVDYDPGNEPPADPEIPTEPEEQPLPEADYQKIEWELLKLTNRERAKAGLAPLTTTKALFQATDIRALELMEQFTHDRPNGGSFDTALSDVGIEFRMAGENKDAGCSSAAEQISVWMGLAETRAHILGSNYAHMGVGYQETDAHTFSAYCDQLFYTDEYCHYTGFKLNRDTLTVDQGTELEDMELWGILTCAECGECYLPILEEYCSDFDPDALGTRTVTVSGPGYSDTVRITVAEDQNPEMNLTECLDSEWEVLRLTNRQRHQHGLDPVTTQDILLKAAGIRAEETTELFENTRPDGSWFSTIFFDLEYAWLDADENIAAGQRTPEEAVATWMDNDDHRANILCGEFMHLGVGYVPCDNANAHYWNQLFTVGWECRYSDLELGVDYLEVEQGTALENIPIWAMATCSYCGDCYLPILPEYCTGYDPNTPGTYRVKVTVFDITDTLEIRVLGEEPEDPTEPEIPTDPVTGYGDVSGDGRVNTLDLIILRQYLAGWDVSADIAAADVNANGSVNTLDLIILRQYLAGWDVTLGG